MTGREKIEAAFSLDGAPEFAAVICYEGIYIRDCWEQLTSCPWWYRHVPDLERQMQWRRDVVHRLGHDWYSIAPGLIRRERQSYNIEVRPDGVYRIDKETGRAQELRPPVVGGWRGPQDRPGPAPPCPETCAQIDDLIGEPEALDASRWLAEGAGDFPAMMAGEFGERLFPFAHVNSPLWSSHGLWGFEKFMTQIADRPDLVAHACRRCLQHARRAVRQAALIGAAGIWIEECFTDMISPDAFARLNVPFLGELVEEIRGAGMKSIYYFCGNPAGKWDMLLDVEADALSLEEGKKGFRIDIEEVVQRVQGRCTVFGNLDAVGVLQNGSDEQLRAEIRRQIAAGRQNASRFVMSIGSPVTPGTPVERVRLYCEIVHELGGLELRSGR